MARKPLSGATRTNLLLDSRGTRALMLNRNQRQCDDDTESNIRGTSGGGGIVPAWPSGGRVPALPAAGCPSASSQSPTSPRWAGSGGRLGARAFSRRHVPSVEGTCRQSKARAVSRRYVPSIEGTCRHSALRLDRGYTALARQYHPPDHHPESHSTQSPEGCKKLEFAHERETYFLLGGSPFFSLAPSS